MKKILYIILLCSSLGYAQNIEWHVRPLLFGGSATGNGQSFSTAWDLQTALNNPGGVIQPGDIVWLHQGDYKGHFSSTLTGTASAYIKVASYPGEWARLDGNIYPFVEDFQDRSSQTGVNATISEEMNTYTDDDELSSAILTVTGAFVRYENFEVTCIGNINRLKVYTVGGINCEPSNGFHAFAGINHTGATKNKFINLVIKNVPGLGIGSWKNTSDSEVYGCIIYNNGYVFYQKLTSCSNTSYNIIGKGPGIYSQNSSSLYRLFENNLFLNNYDSGIFVWSATDTPGSDYLKNFNIKKNIFVNNGGPQRDETANMIIKSASNNAFNHPENINVDRNVFYFNSRTNNVVGVDVVNTAKVDITNNHFFKSDQAAYFASSNENLTFANNFYWGKFIDIDISPGGFLANNWEFNNNTYYKWSYQGLNNIQIPDPTGVHPYIREFLSTIQSPLSVTNGYNTENNSTVTAINGGGSSDILYAYSSPPLPFNTKQFVTQNRHNPNVFYVALFNPKGNTTVNDQITVDFSSYGIPVGTSYKIKDAEDYFGTSIAGTYGSAQTITFPMTLTSIELPTGHFETIPVHTLKDFSVFAVEFGCSDLSHDLLINNQTINTAPVSNLAINNIFFGPAYSVDNGADVTAKAGKQILIASGTHIKSGAAFLAKIESQCPKFGYVGETESQGRIAVQTEPKKNENVDDEGSFAVFPNPNTGIFQVETRIESKISHVIITQVDNTRLVLDKMFRNETLIDVDISKEPRGLYIVQVTFDDRTTESRTIMLK
ncbi:MAG TPA: T9SS type A sorting domain-containing protein [Flavobacterium sp.]|jgi:hypothetical protein